MHPHPCEVVVVESCAPQLRIRQVKPERFDQVQRGAGDGSETDGRTRIGRDARLIENDVEHSLRGYRAGRTREPEHGHESRPTAGCSPRRPSAAPRPRVAGVFNDQTTPAKTLPSRAQDRRTNENHWRVDWRSECLVESPIFARRQPTGVQFMCSFRAPKRLWKSACPKFSHGPVKHLDLWVCQSAKLVLEQVPAPKRLRYATSECLPSVRW